MNEETMRKHYAKTPKETLINILITSREQIEKYKDIVLDLENERDILKSKLSETKADIHYLLENGESIYIRNKYIRGDKEWYL